jgi:hypothetical protein
MRAQKPPSSVLSATDDLIMKAQGRGEHPLVYLTTLAAKKRAGDAALLRFIAD